MNSLSRYPYLSCNGCKHLAQHRYNELNNNFFCLTSFRNVLICYKDDKDRVDHITFGKERITFHSENKLSPEHRHRRSRWTTEKQYWQVFRVNVYYNKYT